MEERLATRPPSMLWWRTVVWQAVDQSSTRSELNSRGTAADEASGNSIERLCESIRFHVTEAMYRINLLYSGAIAAVESTEHYIHCINYYTTPPRIVRTQNTTHS